MSRPSELTRGRGRLGALSVLLLSLLLAAWHSGVRPSALKLGEGWSSAGAVLGGFASPDLSASFLERVARLALESLLIGMLGTALALLLALPLALTAARLPTLREDPAARPLPRALRSGLRQGARALLTVFRSVPEILWAFLFVRIFGLGPGPAVFAIAITFAGIIAKLFAELIEAADPGPARQLRAKGAGHTAVFLYGVLPLVRRQWLAYALFRLECAIRSASILGVVGAGGLGQEIDLSIRYFQYDKLATVLMAVLAYVLVLEIAGHTLRRARPRWSLALLLLGALAGIAILEVPWSALFDASSRAQVATFLAGFAAPTTDAAFLRHALALVLTTVSMAWVATLVAGAGAFALAPMAALPFTIGSYLDDAPAGRGPTRLLGLALMLPARALLQITRALPELVWALLFVVWLGPGVSAGVLALAVHTLGILGRLYGDALEEADPGPPRALEARGAGPLARYLYGVLPQTAPRMLAFSSFRFEVNVRCAAMVGFVGAGGLGDALHTAISLFHMRDLASLMLMTIAVVIALDGLGDHLRLRLIAGTSPGPNA